MATVKTKLSQLKRVSRPFGEVNVGPPEDGRRQVRATVPLGVQKEGSQTGVALDASGSMGENYSDNLGTGPKIRPVAQNLCAFLAGTVDADGGTTTIYWALGTDGGTVQFIKDLTGEEAKTYPFSSPGKLGGGTKLLPAVRYFEERFADAPWGIYVFLTDGEWADHAQVKSYARTLAERVKAGKRNPLKLVIVGVGDGVNEKQMSELDDLTDGTDLPDLWDHKLAASMRDVSDIFAEVVTANARVAKSGKVVDPDGNTLKDYTDVGVPGELNFDVPAGLPYFTLVADGKRFHQALSDADGLGVPTSDPVVAGPVLSGVAPGTQFTKEVPPLPGTADTGGATGRAATANKGAADTGAAATAATTPGEITDFDVSGLARDSSAGGLATDTAVAPEIDLDKK